MFSVKYDKMVAVVIYDLAQSLWEEGGPDSRPPSSQSDCAQEFNFPRDRCPNDDIEYDSIVNTYTDAGYTVSVIAPQFSKYIWRDM